MRRFGLRDDQWERIKNLLPGREGSVGVIGADNRLFVEAVLYRYRTGMPWRDLPARFGEGIKIHTRFSRLIGWAIGWQRGQISGGVRWDVSHRAARACSTRPLPVPGSSKVATNRYPSTKC